jgi:hypothetical protein
MKGKMSKKRGRDNEDRSYHYILDHPEIYGCVSRDHIHVTPRGSKHITDIFCIKYTHNGKEEKAGWDIMVIPDASLHSDTFLIQVKSGMPPSHYFAQLVNFKVPSYIKKELHIWEGDKLVRMDL